MTKHIVILDRWEIENLIWLIEEKLEDDLDRDDKTLYKRMLNELNQSVKKLNQSVKILNQSVKIPL